MHDDENMVVTAVQELMARWERKHMSLQDETRIRYKEDGVPANGNPLAARK